MANLFDLFWSRSKGIYRRPFPETIPELVETGSPAHVGKDHFAVDFLVSEGTPILAPRDGVVLRMKDDSDLGGPHQSFQDGANFIAIRHQDGEISVLIHLEKDSIKVKLGEFVKAGETIARQGSTGWTYEPHIHFAVYQRGESVEIRFKPPLVKK